MRFVIVTKDYAGLGFATRLQDEGHEVILATNPVGEDRDNPDRRRLFDVVGNGMVSKRPLEETLAARESFKDAYWIWDNNHAVSENERLRAEGFKVLSGGSHANTMEHDRHSCLEFAA